MLCLVMCVGSFCPTQQILLFFIGPCFYMCGLFYASPQLCVLPTLGESPGEKEWEDKLVEHPHQRLSQWVSLAVARQMFVIEAGA